MCKFQNISEKKQRLNLSSSPPASDDDGLLSVPAQVLITLACMVTSWGVSWGSSLGWVWIQPSGSISWNGGRGLETSG